MAPAAEQCAELEKIAEAIRVVLNQILFLRASKVEAKNDLEKLERIDLALEKATERESALREMFQKHLQSHGCQPPTAVG